ncbi:unnamed protein product, partial [Rotaria sp. Silwood1]
MKIVIDIVVCIDYTSSIMSYFGEIRKMILSIGTMTLASHGDVRIGLIKFRSCYDRWRTKVHGFISNIDAIEQILTDQDLGGESPDGYKAVGDALYEALNVQWRDNNNNQIFNEKLVILITDSAPNGLFTTLDGADPWVVSKKFEEKDITLVVVGVEESVIKCDDFYCALAKKAGGEYIPLVNAERIIQNIIYWIISEKTTFHQCFRH